MMDRQMALFARLQAEAPGPHLRHDYPGVNSFYDLTYAAIPGFRALTLDLHIPSEGDGPFPVLVWIHGGAWLGGFRGMGHAIRMVDRGYAVAAIQYRLSGEAKFPAQLHDCKGAIRWLRANASSYHLDAQRIVAWGASAGAYLAALLGLTANHAEFEGQVGGNAEQSSAVQGVIDFFGPGDFLAQERPEGRSGGPAPNPVTALLGYHVAERPDEARKAMPITYVHGAAPPFIIMHGDIDPMVPHAQSQRLHEALTGAGAPSRVIILPGALHEDPEFWSENTLGQIAEFLESVGYVSA
jgi:acetyl esterase/lipase